MLKPNLLILFLLLILHTVYSQNNDLILGKGTVNTNAAYYDMGDPTGVNIEVNMWGFVRWPGRYKVPLNTTFLDLMSISGGPLENSNLTEIRIYRPSNDTLKRKTEITKLNYDDLMWGEAKTSQKLNPVLKTGDIILVMEEKRYTFREDLAYYIPIITSLVSLSTLIITLIK